MRKIKVFNMVSADGYFAGSDGNIDWHVVDDEFNKYAVEVLKNVDTILFGRVTYDLFESYWPGALTDPATGKDDLAIAKSIDDATKIVFSKKHKDLKWRNSRLLTEINAPEIQALKEQPGKDIIIYGSGTIVQQLTNLGLIDEYNLMVAPVILGAGKSMFAGVNQTALKLLSTKTFHNGNVLLTYQKS